MTLSNRERQVVLQLATGRGRCDVAARLGMAPKTVDTHVKHINDRLGIAQRYRRSAYIVSRLVADGAISAEELREVLVDA